MESRIEKYYKQEYNKDISRSKKNKDLYKNIYNDYGSLENLPIPENTNEIDITKLKKLATSRDEYKKVKEYERITNKTLTDLDPIPIAKEKEEKIYDINELLEIAKNNNIKITDNDKIITPQHEYLHKLEGDNYLSNLERKKEIYEKIRKEEIKEQEEDRIVATKLSENNQSNQNTASLSLDILSDLKPDDETSPDIAIKDEVKENKMENSAIFYSGSYSFSKNDFDDGFGNIKKNHYFLKTLLLLLGIAICAGITYYYIKFYK